MSIEKPQDAKLRKVAIALPAGSPTADETLWAEPLGNQLYRLDNTPWFARDVALGDIVRCVEEANAPPRFVEVVEQSGNRTVRVFVPDTSDREVVKREIFEFLSSSACKYEGFAKDKGLIAVTIPAQADVAGVLQQLREYQEKGRAYWESGNF